MKRKLLSILLAISMACSMLPGATLAAGSGTETDPIAGTEPAPEEESKPQTLTAEQYAAMVAGMQGTPELLTDEDVFAAAPWLNNTNSGLGIAAIGDGELHPGTYFQTEDNENNAGTGSPDGDLDTYLFRRNAEHPIEVNVTIPAGELPTQSCYVAVRTYDVNSSGQMYPETAEYDVLYVNGTPVGVLTGLDYDWNTSFYQVPVDCLREGENTIQVVMYNCPDIDHFSSIGYTDEDIAEALDGHPAGEQLYRHLHHRVQPRPRGRADGGLLPGLRRHRKRELYPPDAGGCPRGHLPPDWPAQGRSWEYSGLRRGGGGL